MTDDDDSSDGGRKRRPRVVHPEVYTIEIVRKRCTAVSTCMEHASRTFDLDDEAVAIVIKPNGNSPEDILEAAKSCPVDAIFLYDKATGEKVWPPREKRFDREEGDLAEGADEA